MSGCSKFFSFNCINLYAYIDYTVALNITNTMEYNRVNPQNSQDAVAMLNTPIDLYESPYMATYLTSNISNKQLMCFAVNILNGVYDELDLDLDNKIEKFKNKNKDIKSKIDVKKKASVIRSLRRTEDKKKNYIVYTVQNKFSIANCYPV